MTTKEKDATDKGYPTFTNLDTYDDGYPNDVAGFVEAGAAFDPSSDIVRTPHGEDVRFHGDSVRTPKLHEGEDVGPASINARVHKTVAESRERDHRQPVRDTCDQWNAGNVALTGGGNGQRILLRNPRRKKVTITNQGANIMALGPNGGAMGSAPGTCFLGSGKERVFTHTGEIWVMGTAGDLVDWCEEVYDS